MNCSYVKPSFAVRRSVSRVAAHWPPVVILALNTLCVLTTSVPAWSETPQNAEPAKQACHISFDGLEKTQPKGVVVLGTLFKTRSSDYINFVPATSAQSSSRAVWSRSLSKKVKDEALKRVKAEQHVPVLATCDISVTPGRDAPSGPVRTGVYLGPIHNANLTAASYLSQEEAEKLAANLIEDKVAREHFLARFKRRAEETSVSSEKESQIETVVNGMEVGLDHPALFYADDGLHFGLKLKNVSKNELSFVYFSGLSTGVGRMTWQIRDVDNESIWKVGRDPNPGPAPGMPEMMSRKTLKPGESFDLSVSVLGWGKRFWQGDKESDPKQTTSKLPAGKYVASLSVEVQGNGKDDWKGSFTVRSRTFEVSADRPPVPAKVRQTREQIVALARERMVGGWKQLKDAGVAECKALELSDLQAAELKVEESVGKGLEQGQTIYNITFLAPCKKLGGKVQFAWSFDEFGRERSASGVRLIKKPAE